jgi:hypothetical protein
VFYPLGCLCIGAKWVVQSKVCGSNPGMGTHFVCVALSLRDNLDDGPSGFRPFVLPQCLHLQMLLEALHNSANGLWPEETHTLRSAVVHNMLPLQKRKHSRYEVAGAFEALLNWLGSAGAVGLKPQVRLRSCVSRSASIFLDTLPMSAPLTISDAAFARGMQCHLGLLQMSPGALVVSHDSSEQPTPPHADHAKICNPRTKGRDNVPRLAPPSLAPHCPSCWGCNCH